MEVCSKRWLANSTGCIAATLAVGAAVAAEPFVPSIAFLEKVRDELKDRGIVFQVLPWENADPAVYQRLLELGVESFATDYPQVTVDAVREFKSLQEQ